MFFRRSKEPKRPAQAKTVILRFAHKSQATFLGHTKFATNNLSSKYRGQKNSLFTEEQQQDMHRSNNICPISAIWTVVCCVFDSAGFFIGVTYAGKNFAGEPFLSALPAFVTKKSPKFLWNSFAVRTGLEPVTPCVTGRYSNQLN